MKNHMTTLIPITPLKPVYKKSIKAEREGCVQKQSVRWT
jgi:hypothetical protein